MKFLNRLRQIPWENICFFIINSFLFFSIYRFVFPLPLAWFLPAFLFQFSIGFFSQMYSRKSGRIFTATGALLLSRLSWVSEPNLPFHLTDLSGLFLGATLGICMRELILVLLGRGELALPKASDFFIQQWMIRNSLSLKQPSIFFQTPFYFLFWLLVLFICVFLQGFGFSIFYGLGIPEFFYLPGISSREFLSVPVILLTSLSFPILYFLAEERFANSTGHESIYKHLVFGLGIGFLIQLLILLIQTSLLPTFFSGGSNTSLLANRYPGLFLDSGSSSWIVPSLGLFLIYLWYEKAFRGRQRFFYFLMALLIVVITYIGSHQSKAYWVIWICGLFIFSSGALTNRLITKNMIRLIVRISIFLLAPILFIFSLLYFSKMQAPSPLKDIGLRYSKFQAEFLIQPNFDALKKLDETRFELIQVSKEYIIKSPWLGNGLGSLPMLLKDSERKGTKITTKLIDLPPNFAFSVVMDLGLGGSLILFILIGLFVWERSNYIGLFLLFLPFLFGLQIQHADGAFVALFLTFYPMTKVSMERQLMRNSNWFRYTALIFAIGLSLHYLLLYSSQFLNSGIGSEFRVDRLNQFQLQSAIIAAPEQKEYEFHGKVYEWKLAKEDRYRNGKFLIKAEDEGLLLEAAWKDKERKTILTSVFTPANGRYYWWKGPVSKAAVYIELKVNRKTKLWISKDHFSPNSEFRL